MKKIALLFFAASLPALPVQAETLAGWNFYGLIGATSTAATQNATASHVNIGPVTASLGAGQNTGGATGGITNQWNTRGRAVTLNGAIITNTYLTLTITPAAHYEVTVTNVSYRASYSTSIATGTLFSAIGGFTAGSQINEGVPSGVGSATAPVLCNIPVPGGVTFTNATAFRIYFTSGSASTASIRYGDNDTDLGDTCIYVQGEVQTTLPAGTTVIIN
jgi:hypothetical protein